MRRLLAVMTVLSALGALVRYFQVSGNEYLLRLSGADIRRQLARRLPWQQRAGNGDELTLTRPRVRLREGECTVIVGLDITVAGEGDRVAAERGAVEFSATVAHTQPGDFYLACPRLRHLEVPGLTGAAYRRLEIEVERALDKFCAHAPIHQLQDNAPGGGPVELEDVAVVNHHLVLALRTAQHAYGH